MSIGASDIMNPTIVDVISTQTWYTKIILEQKPKGPQTQQNNTTSGDNPLPGLEQVELQVLFKICFSGEVAPVIEPS
jgi:hypothetical protein